MRAQLSHWRIGGFFVLAALWALWLNVGDDAGIPMSAAIYVGPFTLIAWAFFIGFTRPDPVAIEVRRDVARKARVEETLDSLDERQRYAVLNFDNNAELREVAEGLPANWRILALSTSYSDATLVLERDGASSLSSAGRARASNESHAASPELSGAPGPASPLPIPSREALHTTRTFGPRSRNIPNTSARRSTATATGALADDASVPVSEMRGEA